MLLRLAVLTLLALPSSLSAVDFVHEVMPILNEHCAECHTGKKKKGGLSMNTRAELLDGGENDDALIPGKAADSPMIHLISSGDEDEWMPPKGPRVSAEEIAVLEKWINAGAPWESGITLGESSWEPPLKPRQVTLPDAQAGRNHPIDRLLDAGLATRKHSRPKPASDAAFFRRASLDTTGLLPNPDALQAFEANPASDKREKLIEHLLSQDVAYADHWLTTWNDLLRNDYTGTGFITGGRKQITTWLYASLRDNKPYDQLVRELVSPTKESAGFIDGIKWRGDVNSSQTREIQFSQNISQVFLGINMKCASCHDSFIDRWTLSEAYNLAAIYADTELELNRCDKPTGEMATPKWIFPEIGDVDPKAPKAERLKQLSKLITHPDNGRFTRTLVNRIWERLMGRGIVHPVDAMHTEPWNEDLLDYLALRFAKDGYDLRKFIGFVMSSQAYQSRTVILEKEPGEDYAYTGPIAKRMTAEQLLDSIWQITGTHPAKAEAKADRTKPRPANPGNPPTATPPLTAKWIWLANKTAPKSQFRRTFPLKRLPDSATLVATCDNAFTLKINGKVVASSKEWNQPVHVDVKVHLKKGKNLLEVNGEMFGGGAGFIAQLSMTIDEKDGVVATDKHWEARPPFGNWQPATEIASHGSAPWGPVLDKAAKASAGPNSPTPPVRAALVKNDFLMRSLGRPHRDQVVTSRPGELTTLQAIDLSNGDILAGYLRGGAKNILLQGKSAPELMDWLYLSALSRPPTAGERRTLTEIIGSNQNDTVAVEDLLWSIFMHPEFQIIR